MDILLFFSYLIILVICAVLALHGSVVAGIVSMLLIAGSPGVGYLMAEL